MSREKFEAWAKEQGYETYRQKTGSYFFEETHIAWQVWSAATASLQAERDQLAAENVEAKKIISECREYFIAGVMNRIRPTNEGYLHMICDTFADETPATDRIVAEAEARGVEKGIAHLEKKFSNIGVQIMNLQWLADSLREGASE